MKDSIKWLIIAVTLVGVIIGAYFLYGALTEDNSGGGFIIDMPDTGALSTGAQTEVKNDTTDTVTQSVAQDTEAPSTEVGSETTKETADEEPTNPAPDFTVVDKDGKEVKLSDMRGRPVVVNFWASWCPPCKAEMPDFEEMYKKYGDKVVFMMVNMTDGFQETLSKAKAHIADNGYTFPVYFDTKSSAAYTYNVSSIPATYLVDSKGNLVAHATGMISGKALEEGIGLILD